MNAPVAPVRLQPDFAQRPIPEAFLQALAQRFGAQCSTALAVREQHGRDEGAIQAPRPRPWSLPKARRTCRTR